MFDEVEGNEELSGTSTASALFCLPNKGSREEDAIVIGLGEERGIAQGEREFEKEQEGK